MAFYYIAWPNPKKWNFFKEHQNLITYHKNFSMCIGVEDQINFRFIAKSCDDFEFVGICAFRNYLVLKQIPNPQEMIAKLILMPQYHSKNLFLVSLMKHLRRVWLKFLHQIVNYSFLAKNAMVCKILLLKILFFMT